MCTSYYRLIWRFYSYIICMLNLVIFYHYMSWTVPSWCNLNLQQCSINIIQTLYSVCMNNIDWKLFELEITLSSIALLVRTEKAIPRPASAFGDAGNERSLSIVVHDCLSFRHDRQSSEQNNRNLISLHNNGEDDKHVHGFADF
jgi:hypothetical protein